jgi:hypothetical protein
MVPPGIRMFSKILLVRVSCWQMCFVTLAKSRVKFLLRVLGLQQNLFHVATEDISWDPEAFERFSKISLVEVSR